MSERFYISQDRKRCLVTPGVHPLGSRRYLVEQGVLKSEQDPTFEEVIHGHVEGCQMYAYLGANFQMPERTVDLINALRLIATKLEIDHGEPVLFGVRSGRPGKSHQTTSRRMEFVKCQIW
jgi:hypothetical protein